MVTLNASQKYWPNDPAWYILAEYPLSDLLIDGSNRDEITNRALDEAFRDLEVTQECLQKLESTLVMFAQETVANSQQGNLEISIYIRLFCQKKMFEKGDLIKNLKDSDVVQTVEPANPFHYSQTKGYGGWGYFIIERGKDFHPRSSSSQHDYIDVYLYREGE